MSEPLRAPKLVFGVAAVVLAALLVVSYVRRPELEEVDGDECDQCTQDRRADSGDAFGDELLGGRLKPRPNL